MDRRTAMKAMGAVALVPVVGEAAEQRTGFDRFFDEQMNDPEVRRAYEEIRTKIMVEHDDFNKWKGWPEEFCSVTWDVDYLALPGRLPKKRALLPIEDKFLKALDAIDVQLEAQGLEPNPDSMNAQGKLIYEAHSGGTRVSGMPNMLAFGGREAFECESSHSPLIDSIDCLFEDRQDLRSIEYIVSVVPSPGGWDEAVKAFFGN